MHLQASRVATFARLYENWRLKSISFRFEHTFAQTFGGSLLAAFDMDANDEWPEAGGRPNILRGENSKYFWEISVSESKAVGIPANASRKSAEWLYTDDYDENVRTWSPGRFYLMVKTPLTDETGAVISATTQIGDLHVEYHFEFDVPALEDVNVGVASHFVGSSPTEFNFFGTQQEFVAQNNIYFLDAPHLNTFKLPRGSYLIYVYIKHASFSAIDIHATTDLGVVISPSKFFNDAWISGQTCSMNTYDIPEPCTFDLILGSTETKDKKEKKENKENEPNTDWSWMWVCALPPVNTWNIALVQNKLDAIQKQLKKFGNPNPPLLKAEEPVIVSSVNEKKQSNVKFK